MPDYKKGKIYRIVSPSKNLVYYGSTTQTISQRLQDHLKEYRLKTKPCKSFIVLECEDYKIELIEEYSCNNRQQLEKKEGEYQKNNECVNEKIAGRTKTEWYYDNQERLLEKRKNYYQDNVEIERQKNKDYQKNNKEKIKQYHKDYYQRKKQEQVNI